MEDPWSWPPWYYPVMARRDIRLLRFSGHKFRGSLTIWVLLLLLAVDVCLSVCGQGEAASQVAQSFFPVLYKVVVKSVPKRAPTPNALTCK